MAVIGLGILVGSQIRDGRINFLPRASEADNVKIMTFNVLSEPLCRGDVKHTAEMKALMDYIRNNKISVAGLQEVVKLNVDVDDCPDFDLPQYIQDNASGYTVSKSEYIHISRDSDNREDNIEKWWYRLFVQDSPMVGDMQRIQIGEQHSGFDVMVTNTKLGPIRFINLHNHHHQMMDSLIPLVNQFKAQDSIPIIVLGDFNIVSEDNGRVDEFHRIKYLEDAAGLYRACDPVKFPNAGCTDTVKSTDSESNYAIDHIFIEKELIL
jgi:endonuclease/exonuclease/phosphatase family metal-dependent hydrolase